MAETIGKKLRTTRESKGLSLNDVAFETRMHPSFVEALEMDDYSAFANTTYARSFLTLYCRFLNVDAGDAIEQFSGGRNVTWNSNGSLMVLQTVGGADSATRERFFARPEPVAMGNGRNAPRFPIGLGLMVFVLLVTIPILYIVGRNAETPEEAQAKLLQLTRGLSNKGEKPVEVESAAPQQDASPPPQVSVAIAETGAPTETAPVAAPKVAVPADRSATPEKVVKPAPVVPSVPVPVATEVATPVPAPATPNALPLRASPIIAIPVDPNAADEPVIEESAAAPLPTAETSPAPVAQQPTAETESIRESATAPPVMPQVVSDRPRIKGTEPAVSQAETSKFVDPNHRFPRTR